jgi:flagellar biosynthesis activator protein FlaF
MKTMSHATRAYEAASVQRSQRAQEADVFHRTIGALRGAREGTPIDRVKALADNRRLWTAVSDLMRDPASTLPPPLRAQIISVGMTVQREMDNDEPNFDFLITINEHIAAGLTDAR